MNKDVGVLPSDVKPHWLNVIRRLQSVARQSNQGYAILTISVLVDADGCPKMWTEPNCTKLEPKKCGEDILSLLANFAKQ
jgi:hypothetical protein